MTNLERKNQGWLPSVFNEMFDYPLFAHRTMFNSPAINVRENKREYIVEVAAPGMTREDFDVRINKENYLIITLEKSKEEVKEEPKEACECKEGDKDCKCEERYLRREFSLSRFQQTMILPDNVDKDHIKANVKDGVLRLVLPKLTDERIKQTHRTIEIL